MALEEWQGSRPVTVRAIGDVGEDSRSELLFDRGLTISETAQILAVSDATVRRLIRDGQIAHQRVSPRRIVVRESALVDYMRATTVAAEGCRDRWGPIKSRSNSREGGAVMKKKGHLRAGEQLVATRQR